MLNAHGEDVDADDERDEEVQVVAGTQCVDGQTQGGVVRIVRPLLGLWNAQTNKQTYGRTETVSDFALKHLNRACVQWCAQEGAREGEPPLLLQLRLKNFPLFNHDML